jgi:hypothetical protein
MMMTIHMSWAWLEWYLLFCAIVIAVVVAAVDHEILFSQSELLYIFLRPVYKPQLAHTEVRPDRPGIRNEEMVDGGAERVHEVAQGKNTKSI